MGPIIVDIAGFELTQEDKEILRHPLSGGLILFSRNYHDPEQLRALIKSIRHTVAKPFLIAVDHEGGRVQRFREHFSAIPAMGKIAEYYHDDKVAAAAFAQSCGWLLAAELLAYDIDLSFAPVLDLERGSQVIGDRSFHRDPEWVTPLASALCKGMHGAGMKTTGKHFPGHGSVFADSHIALPVDPRSLNDIKQNDLLPFAELIKHANLDAIMPAHVVYENIDPQAAGFSQYWLQKILKTELGFKGSIFSDDLSMHGASVAGDYLERAQQARWAGCDLLLACNDRKAVETLLDGFANDLSTPQEHLLHRTRFDSTELQMTTKWQQINKTIEQFNCQFM